MSENNFFYCEDKEGNKIVINRNDNLSKEIVDLVIDKNCRKISENELREIKTTAYIPRKDFYDSGW